MPGHEKTTVTRLVLDSNRLPSTAGVITLEPGESHYLRQVRRLSAGDPVTVLDGQGRMCKGTLTSATTLTVDAPTVMPADPGPSITLAFSPPKGKRLDTLIEKATELGVTTLIPVLAERTVRRVTERNERWDRIIQAAARQSMASRMPTVTTPQTLLAFLAAHSADLKLLATPHSTTRMRGILPRQEPENITVLTGPEGGFTSNEITDAEAAGYTTFNLGSRILRAESAPLAILAVLQHRYGDLG